MSEQHYDLARARSEAASRLARQDLQRTEHVRAVDQALRKQDERTRKAVADFLAAADEGEVQPTNLYTACWHQVGWERRPFRRARPKYEALCVSGHVVWSRYEDECTTRTICVLTSGHVLFSKGHRDSAVDMEVESFGDYWRRGESCCNGELPFQLGRGDIGAPQLGRRDRFWGSWPEQEVVSKIEQTTAWFVRTLGEYLAKRGRS